jgi:DNA repair photolyase
MPSHRGARYNPPNRFVKEEHDVYFEHCSDEAEKEQLATMRPKTRFLDVHPNTILNTVTSPDLPFRYSLNPYQGCEHGCVYCYARNSHQYWGYSAGVDFESVILIKRNAADLLKQVFQKKKYQCAPIMLSGNTDCYQPMERKLGLTRSILELCVRYRHPLGIITKNSLIERDVDYLSKLAAHNLVSVNLSLTTLDPELKAKLEPRAPSPKRVLQTVARLSEQHIPVTIMIAPIIPGLNDHEIPAVVQAAAEQGATSVNYTVVRLNEWLDPLFTDWIEHHYPHKAKKVLTRIRDMHGGVLHDSRFGTRMQGEGLWADMIRQHIHHARRRYMPDEAVPRLNSELFTGSTYQQLSLNL